MQIGDRYPASVYIWPDFDKPGASHAASQAEICQQLEPAPEIFLLDPDDLGLQNPGDDVVEYLAAFGGDTVESKRDAIYVALSHARQVSAAGVLHERIEDIIAGRYTAIELPKFTALHRLTQALLPGTVTIVAGDPGDGKSFLALTWMLDLHFAGIPVSIFELEEDKAFWLTRLLAILECNGDLTNPEWVKQNAEIARAAYQRHKVTLDQFAARLFISDGAQFTHGNLVSWIRSRASAGDRVIAVDPVTALASSSEPWIDDRNLMMNLKTAAKEFNCSILLVTHPRIRRGGREGGLDDVAGGAAFVRFAQAVFWIKRFKRDRTCRWASSLGGHSTGPINRAIKIAKARNGAGGGMEIAARFDGRYLRFVELGPILDDEEDGA